jgi:putative aldouronate transport system permease protein
MPLKSKKIKIFPVLNGLFLIFLMIAMLYPFIHAIFASFSDPQKLLLHNGFLLIPIRPYSFDAYIAVFKDARIATGYRNTLIYLSLGTFINILLTSMAAYTLSLRRLMLRNIIMFAITFTMLFSGGMIPTYIQVYNLRLVNTLWAMVLPNAINTFNLIVMRTYFQGIPESLRESARIDGANDIRIFARIILPLATPVLAVMLLYYGVYHWNSWFPAAMYLRRSSQYPLQIVLRDILIINSTDIMTSGSVGSDKYSISETIKYATIIVSTVPILLIYPFLQKYFTKGVMIGAIKG